jgi:cytochrome c
MRRARVVLLAAAAFAACEAEDTRFREMPPALVGADPERGRLALRLHGCVTCHVAPNVVGGDQRVGPTLVGFAERRTVAGSMPNTPENAIRWIVAPQRIAPGSAMPDMGVDVETARDIVAYLHEAS